MKIFAFLLILSISVFSEVTIDTIPFDSARIYAVMDSTCISAKLGRNYNNKYYDISIRDFQGNKMFTLVDSVKGIIVAAKEINGYLLLAVAIGSNRDTLRIHRFKFNGSQYLFTDSTSISEGGDNVFYFSFHEAKNYILINYSNKVRYMSVSDKLSFSRDFGVSSNTFSIKDNKLFSAAKNVIDVYDISDSTRFPIINQFTITDEASSCFITSNKDTLLVIGKYLTRYHIGEVLTKVYPVYTPSTLYGRKFLLGNNIIATGDISLSVYDLITNQNYSIRPSSSSLYMISACSDNICFYRGEYDYDKYFVMRPETSEVSTEKFNNLSVVSHISIVPNPAMNFVNITFNGQHDNSNQIEIYNITGKKILSRNMRAPKLNLPLSEFSSGVYYCKVKALNRVYHKRFSVF